MSEAAAKFAGDIPANYDRCLGPVLFEHYAEDLVNRVCEHMPNDILELACGTGIVSKRLFERRCPGAKLTATDLNADMISIARAKMGDHADLSFAPADALELPYSDSSFDAVACQFGVMFFPDKDQGYAEVRRVLKPGGRYHFNTWANLEDLPAMVIANDVMHRLFPDDPPGFYRVPFSYADCEAICQSLDAAGFSSVSVNEVAVDQPVVDLDAFSYGLVHGNPLIVEINERGTVSADEAVAALRSALAAEFGDIDCCIPLKAYVVSAAC
jgi:SAM-dependent methyltransferase